MRTYLEVTELVKDEEADAEFIRIDVTDLADSEREKVKAAIKDIMSGKTYSLKRHDCGHNEGKACVTEEI